MKLNKLFSVTLAVGFLSCFAMAAVAQEDVIILNRDGEQVAVEKVKEVRKQAGEDDKDNGKADVKIENGKVTVVDSEGNVQTFDIGEARSVSVNRSIQVVDNNGERQTKSVNKMIVVAPDGERHIIAFDGDGMNKGGVLKFGKPKQALAPEEKSYMVGINCQPVSELLQAHLQLEPNTGLVVKQVVPDGPAEKAGVQVNDIMMYADDQQLSNQSDLMAATDRAGQDGSKLSLTLIRAGEETNVEVEPVEREGLTAGMPQFRAMPGMVMPNIQIFGDFEAMPGFEFKDMGPGVIIGPGAAARGGAGFEAMNERIQELHEKIEKMHNSMLDEDFGK